MTIDKWPTPRYTGQLTMGQFREATKDVPDDFVISTQGCDCIGPSDGTMIDQEERTVLVERNDSLTETPESEERQRQHGKRRREERVAEVKPRQLDVTPGPSR